MAKIEFMLLCFIATACMHKAAEETPVKYNNKLIEPIINGYINFLNKERPNDTFSVLLETLNDSTTLLGLGPGYPDITIEQPIYYIEIRNYTVYFIGKEDSTYFEYPKEKKTLPEDILAYTKKMQEVKSPFDIPEEDLEATWDFYFVRGKLIKYGPRNVVEKYVYIPPGTVQ